MEHSTLIVDSNIFNRRQLVTDAISSGTTRVIEAISCNHGLQLLRDDLGLDTCLLGPRLKLKSATQFLTTAVQIVEQRSTPCSFLVTVPEDVTDEHREALEAAGADVLLKGPLGNQSFTELVRRAIARDYRVPGKAPVISSGVPQSVSFIPAEHSYKEARMDKVLLDLAERLKLLAKEIDNGNFNVRKNGAPSLAAADAIRVTFEASFPESYEVWKIGSQGHLFVESIVRWFEARPHLSSTAANEMLRQALLGKSSPIARTRW